MKHISEIIEDILVEWAYRVHDGMPNPKNTQHIIQLRESMEELNLPNDVIYQVIENLLTEKDKKEPPLDDSEKDKAREKKLIWKGQGYGKEDEEGITHKNVGGKLVPVDKEDDKQDDSSPKGMQYKDSDEFLKSSSDTDTEEKTQSKEELRDEDDELTNTQLTLKKGDPQEKGGLGTPQSRTGETVTVWAGKKVQELMKEEGLSYEEARKAAEDYLMGLTKEKDALLTKEWVESGLNCLDYLENNIGIENIEEFAWDTDEGNQLVGSTGHGTSADMFVKTKDGELIGVSLKKDFKVFIVNGGYKTSINKLGKMMDAEIPEEVSINHYMKRRTETLDKGVAELNKPNIKSEVCKNFDEAKADNPAGSAKRVFGAAAEKRIRQVALKKIGISSDKFKKLPPKEQKQHVDGVTCDDLYEHVINDSTYPTDSIKVIANLAKQANPSFYDDLRSLDNEMSENMFGWLNQDENSEKFKDLVKKETHILDVLFGSEGPLDRLDVLYGEEGGVTMSPEAVSNLFGINDLYNEYKNMEDGPEREELKKQIEEEINKKLVITKDKGKPVISVKVTKPDGTPFEVPIFGVGVRSRGIGASPTLEIFQSTFGSLAFKNGNVDLESWPDKDKKKVSDSEAKSILSDIENEQYDLSKIEDVQELKDRLEFAKSLVSKDSSYIKKVDKILKELDKK